MKILKAEIKTALQNSRNGVTLNPNQIPFETFQCMKDDTLFNKVYKTGHVPKQWSLFIFSTIPETTNAKYCCEYRTISVIYNNVISQAFKFLLKVIHGRYNKKSEEDIFHQNLLTQEYLGINMGRHAVISWHRKSFDKLWFEKIATLQTKTIDNRDLRIITNLH